MNELKERVKELNCLYGLTKIVKNTKYSVDEALQNIIALIPPAWQYPEITCARISFEGGKEYTTKDFRESKWSQISNIIADEKKIGVLEVYYTEERPILHEGPFLKEERRLIDAIATLIGQFFEERRVKEELKKKKIAPYVKPLTDSKTERFTKKKQDWEVIIDLLIKTDPRTLLRITRKMTYYLYRHGNEKITDLQNQITPIDSKSTARGINMPNPRTDLQSLITFQKQVFDIAKESIPSDVISDLFRNWLRSDKARPLLLTSQKTGVPLNEIREELTRFMEQTDIETSLSEEDIIGIKTAMIRRFVTDRLEYVNVGKSYFELEDFVQLLSNIIGPAQGAGKLGGKSGGVVLAEKILRKEMANDALLKDIDFPRSWYITSDTVAAFVHHNDLDDVFHVKYLDPGEIRQEQPFLEQIFKNASFPYEIVEGLRGIITAVKDKPIIVRSSSLLEDSYGAAFSGKYKSLFVPNLGSEEERLKALMDAIAEVYASTFGPDPIEYRRERGLLDFNEEMGILVQEVVGTHIGPYYMPSYAGVAFSRNEFRWSPRIRREDAMIRLVPGLGTRAVDRIGNDYPILVSPFRPELQVNTLIEERIKYSPRYMDVINMQTGLIETVEIEELLRTYGEQIPLFENIVSIHEHGRLIPPSIMTDTSKADLIVTFQNLFDKSDFLPKMKRILSILEEKMGSPVDVEFACDGKTFYFLQCRPQSQARGMERIPVPKDIPREQKLFTAKRFITTGQIENIEYIVYVNPEAYGALESREKMLRIARIVGDLNNKLPKRKFILMGPGRWGSRGDIKLGVPVRYADINNTALLIEIAKEKGEYTPELSFGTHFFQDLVEANIRYLPLYPDQQGNIFNEEILHAAENHIGDFCNGGAQTEPTIRLIKVSDIVPGGSLRVVMDGDAGEALGYFKPPDHWDWRVQKVKQIAKSLDPELYGIQALYVIGSTKDGGAGPASDIDLLVHFRGTDEQREKLLEWFATWGKKLDDENTERTGIKTGGLLDIHIVTDEDIRNKTSWATHLTSPYLTALKVPLEKEPL